MTTEEKVENWFIPLSTTELTLMEAHSQLDEYGLEQDDVPLIIQLVENPKFDLPGIDIFHGATNLETHTQVLDASCAVLCQPTANDFADGIARVLEDPEGYAEIARGARKRVESEYSFEAFGRKLLAAYESLD